MSLELLPEKHKKKRSFIAETTVACYMLIAVSVMVGVLFLGAYTIELAKFNRGTLRLAELQMSMNVVIALREEDPVASCKLLSNVVASHCRVDEELNDCLFAMAADRSLCGNGIEVIYGYIYPQPSKQDVS
jgi:hypothetical protein